MDVLHSTRPAVRLPEGGLYHFIHGKLLEFGPNPALIDAATGDQLTYGELLLQVERVSYHLHNLGVKEGDVFALCAPNSVNYVILLLALARLGAVFAPLNSLSTGDDLKYSLPLAGAKFLCTTETLADDFGRTMDSTSVEMVLVDGRETVCSLFEPIPEGQSAPPVRTMPSDAVCGILFSSGTTGLPKAVELTHRSFLSQSLMCSAADIGNTGGVFFQPLSHLLGTGMLLTALNCGTFIVIMSRFHPETFFQLVEKYKVKQIVVVPPILVLLAKSPLLDKYDFSSVEDITAGAAPVSAELEQEVMSRLGNQVSCIRQAYALTEASVLVSSTPTRSSGGQTDKHPPGSVGTLSANVQIKVTDIRTEEVLGANQTGEIRIKSEFTMKGYKGNPQATREMVDSEGWMRTGDVGYYNDRGYLFVVDRIKELIKYNAYQVPPAELEGLLLTHPGVADSGVIGLPDKAAGELPHAWVVRKPDCSVTEQELVDFVAGKVAPYKKLRGGVKFVDKIPKSAAGKIIRRLMRDEMKMCE